MHIAALILVCRISQRHFVSVVRVWSVEAADRAVECAYWVAHLPASILAEHRTSDVLHLRGAEHVYGCDAFQCRA
jgi:hypothetical protein